MSDERTMLAGKDPNLTAVARMMARGKLVVTKYLNDQTGMFWTPPDKPYDRMYGLNYTWYGQIQKGEPNPNNFRLTITYTFDSRAETYEVSSYIEKGSRGVGGERVSGLSLEDLRDVKKILPSSAIADIGRSLKGDYSKEVADIKQKAISYQLKCQEELEKADELAALAHDPIANSRKIHNLHIYDHAFRNICDLLDIIEKGR